MSIEAMQKVWEYSDQKGSALLLLLAIADYAQENGRGAWPSVATLADKIRMTERNTQLLLAKLEEAGELHIEVGAGPHRTNLYNIIFPTVKRARVKTFQGEKSSKKRVKNPAAPKRERVKEDSPDPLINPSESTTTMGQPESTTPQPASAAIGGGGQKPRKAPTPAPEMPNRTETFIWLAEAEDGPRLGDLGTLNRCANLPLAAVQAEWARVRAQGKGGGWLVKVIMAPTWRADVPPPPTARELAHRRQLEYAAEELRRNLARLDERKNAPQRVAA